MRIGYSFWGFLGDNKLDESLNEISAPDGNATYSWSLIWEMQRRGHTVLSMQEDRDYPAWKKFGKDNFASFSQEKRVSVYQNLKHTFGSPEILPELDLLLVEWRFPIFGRNCNSWEGQPVFPSDWTHGEHREVRPDGQEEILQPDLLRQYQILRHYKQKKTKIVFWDLDHKLRTNEEAYWKPDAILETSHSPLKLFKERTRVEPPIITADLLQHPTLPPDPNRKAVYIGSRYERDDVITKWLRPLSESYPGSVEFHGNWLKTVDECRKLWPNISYNPRCTVQDFRRIYGTAASCPLLAKQSYLDSGFITPRPWEALMFGTIPIGLGAAKGIEQYVEFCAHDGTDMIEVAELLAGLDVKERDRIRKENVARLEFMDARFFVDTLEKVA